MNVRLMLTCLCDALYGEVGIATVRVLEHAGCNVEFPESQTCCGQPPFNAGDWNAARPVALRCAELFAGDTPVVTPSASCAAMVRHGYSMLMRETPFVCYELCEFLVQVRGIDKWPGKGLAARRVAFHQSCHGRILKQVPAAPSFSSQKETLRATIASSPRSGPPEPSLTDCPSPQRVLLASIPGLEVIDMPEPEQCCGFGGAFSATHGSISAGIGLRKLEMAIETGATEIVSGDMGCLMHLDGLIQRHELSLKARHIAEILAEAIP